MVETWSDVARAGTRRMRPLARWTGCAAFVWALLFAAAHGYWAFGGTVLLGDGQAAGTPGRLATDSWADVMSWTLVSVLIVGAGIFSLALGWRDTRVKQSTIEEGNVLVGWGGTGLLAVFGLATREVWLVVLGGGAWVLGLLVSIVRPRHRPARS